MKTLKRRIFKNKPKKVYDYLQEDDKKLSIDFLSIIKKNNFETLEDEKNNDKELIIEKDFAIYLKELSFALSDLNLFLPKDCRTNEPLKFLTKPFIKALFEEIHNNSNPSSIFDIASFLKGLINIDIELDNQEISKGLINCGVFLVFDGFLNQNIIYFSNSNPNLLKSDKGKYIIFKGMEIIINMVIKISEILDIKIIKKTFIQNPLNFTLMNYLRGSKELENLCLKYFDSISKNLSTDKIFQNEVNLKTFLLLIHSKISKPDINSMENNILALRILHNFSINLQNTEIESQDLENFQMNQKELLIENIFSIVGIKIFEEIDNLLNNLQAKTFQAPKKSKQKFLKEFSLDQHIKEGINIWFSSAKSLELALELLNDIYKEDQNLSEESQSISVFDENEEMELENENDENLKGIVEENIKIELEQNNDKISDLIGENLLEFGLEKLLYDKIKFPLKNQLEFMIFYEQKIGTLFKNIKKIIFLTINCFINIISSKTMIIAENGSTLAQNLMYCINSNLAIIKDFDENQNYDPEEIDLRDILVSSLKLFCLIIEKNQEICKSLNYHDIFLMMEIIESLDEESFLIFIDILSIRFSSNFSNIEENQEICKIFSKLLKTKQNIMIIGQILNCIFDIFKDEKFDENFKTYQLLDILKKVSGNLKQNKLKNHLKSGKKSDLEFLSETSSNLKRFINYKEKSFSN